MIDLIDPHVHCRDDNWAYKDTIAHVFEVANAQGVKVIFDMPNSDPPVEYKYFNGFFNGFYSQGWA